MKNTIKKNIFLVQGEKRLVKNYLHLAESNAADAIFLTYDEKLDGAIFFPNSTWAEGRNRLLEEALKRDPYEYYIFCDDDIEFESGGWEQFQDELVKNKPGIAVPIFPKTINSALKFPKLSTQPFFINDEQLMAFHHDVVKDRLVLPYQTQFDKENWWISCEIQQILIQNFYPLDCLQFNTIVVKNICEKRYDAEFDHKRSFRDTVKNWLDKEFKDEYRLTSFYVPLRLHLLLLRTLLYKVKRLISKRCNVSFGLPARLLAADSEILNNSICKADERMI